jgi:beta-aspartyl-dipeptidase (metallo-type)
MHSVKLDACIVHTITTSFCFVTTGISHIVLGGGKVLGVLPHSDDPETICNTAQIMDAQGLLAVPGFVDCHVHIAGGGGEAGPSSRTPESSLPQFLSAGTTTVVGLLGTDGITRSLENLVAKARALTADGMTAYFWTGGG